MPTLDEIAIRLDKHMDKDELLFTALNAHMGRIEKAGWAIVGLLTGYGVLNVVEFLKLL